MQSTAVSFDGASLSLSLITEKVDVPPVGGLIARVTMAGICGTDAHRLVGDVPKEDAPISFGHEAVGVVAELGVGRVTDWHGQNLAVGDRITWFPPAAGCGHCQNCLDDFFLLCEEETWPYPSSRPNPAGFQQYATLSARVPVYKVPNDIPDEAYVAFGCALPTAVNGMDVLGQILPAQTVLVQGCGPVGLASIALATLASPAQLIVIGAPAKRLEWATRLGATTALDITTTTQAERAERVRELTDGRGADVVIEAAGQPAAFTEGIELLARRGRYLISGLFSGSRTVEVNPVLINNRSLHIMGNLGGKRGNLGNAVALASRLQRRFAIADLVTDRFELAEIATAIRSSGIGLSTKTVVVP
ncbi:zinc-binding dehydrogenase [Arthrobacter mobilis]|uniref:Zinc-binding dehydrogenase n=1 Tax=Arthrobacter mobilis TaxID=2724944 RepID=A0A7X6K6Y1_9MICC|nr:zinc-binding dehydrogenase [Arthrobacter mobilis]NKX55898.1 zinc-binding dehydrogenase [Arthrobacter mobilis]